MLAATARRTGWDFTAYIGPSMAMGEEEPARTETIRMLLAAGADVDAVDAAGRSALAYAAHSWATTIVAILIKAKAKSSLADVLGKTALDHVPDELDTLEWAPEYREAPMDEGRKIAEILRSSLSA